MKDFRTYYFVYLFNGLLKKKNNAVLFYAEVLNSVDGFKLHFVFFYGRFFSNVIRHIFKREYEILV